MSLLLDSFAEAIRPREKIPPHQWAAGGKITIPNSAVSSRYEPESAPWFLEPLEFATNGQMREGYVIAPTGSGKTTLFDILIPYWIANDPGSILAVQATDPEAADYAEKRLNPILDSCEDLKPLFDSLGRHKRKRDSITFPHMDLELVGANLSSLQRKSKRYLLGDECWLWKHGLMAEARARMHDRWNRVAMWVSQGGFETQYDQIAKTDYETELYAGWRGSDRRIWNFQCPQCGEVQPYLRKQLEWTTQNNDAGELDIAAILQSTRYKCRNCPEQFEDTPINRRALADTGRYVATNPNHKPGIHGWNYNVLTVYRIPWSEFAIAWARAKIALENGDKKPLEAVIQKRLAEFWRELPDVPETALTAGDYHKADYANGEMIDNEIARFMTIDRQRDHRWVKIRAWRADGSSRLLLEGKSLTKESCREIQRRYKVRDGLTFQDAQYETGDVYDECVEYGWTAMHGEGKQKTFLHSRTRGRSFRAFYSPMKQARAPHGGRANYIFWSNEGVKDELVQLRAGGRRPPFEFPQDVSPEWLKHMVSEVKIDGTYVNQGRPNHLWDCEAMGVAAAMIFGVLVGITEETDEKPAEAQG
jgi:phage terminase large subunit GpA-like protein